MFAHVLLPEGGARSQTWQAEMQRIHGVMLRVTRCFVRLLPAATLLGVKSGACLAIGRLRFSCSDIHGHRRTNCLEILPEPSLSFAGSEEGGSTMLYEWLVLCNVATARRRGRRCP
jgi:hypothetical protein